MTQRNHLRWPLFAVGSIAIAVGSMIGCSSAEPEASGCTPGETVACSCGVQTGTSMCGSPTCSCDEADSGASAIDTGIDAAAIDMPGDATHLDDKPAPLTTYGECAAKGSFGWPCSADASGPDEADCTDPNFPECFVGGQGAWCTASCATFGVCPGENQEAGPDGGCVPTACNARGYCK